MTVPRLPGVGTTWYERGFAYWCRRVGAALLLCIAVAVYVAIIAGVVTAAGRPGSPGFLAVLIGETVFSLVTGVLSFRHLWRLGITGRSVRRDRGAAGAAAGAGLSAFWLGGAGAALLVVAALISAGFALGALAIWLTPVPPAERRARQLLADEISSHRYHGHPHTKRRA
jgi:hypothetical protein